MCSARTLLILGTVLFICANLTTCWRRRRRRRCEWHWNGWSACSAPCGNAGTQTRTASGCGAPGPQTQACNRFCHNGGTPLSYSCSCHNGFEGACCQNQPCSFVRCPKHRIEITLPEYKNYVEVNMRDYVLAVDAELNETRPLPDASSDVTYPVTKYQVSPDRNPSSAGEYLFPPARFTICNDMRACAFSVIVKDNIAPQLVHCPSSYHHLQEDSCRDVNVYDYYSTSEMTSWFRDNVGIKEVHCKQPTVNTIAPGKTASVACQANDIVGNPSADCNITFYCVNQVCPPLRPPKFGALVCHEDQQEKKCILFCTEGKLHTKPNIFRCDMSEPSPTWTGAHGTTVDRVNCKEDSRHEPQFTVNTTCTPGDEAFYSEMQQTLSDTKGEHHLCYNVSDVDCDITVTCANYFNQVTTISLLARTTITPTTITNKGPSTASTITSLPLTANKTLTTARTPHGTTKYTPETTAAMTLPPTTATTLTTARTSADTTKYTSRKTADVTLPPTTAKTSTNARTSTSPSTKRTPSLPTTTATTSATNNSGDDKPPKAEINEKSKLPLTSVIAAAAVLCVVAIVITFIIIIKKTKKAPVADAYRSQDLEPDPVVPGDSVKCSKALKNEGQRDKFIPSMEEQLVKIE